MDGLDEEKGTLSHGMRGNFLKIDQESFGRVLPRLRIDGEPSPFLSMGGFFWENRQLMDERLCFQVPLEVSICSHKPNYLRHNKKLKKNDPLLTFVLSVRFSSC